MAALHPKADPSVILTKKAAADPERTFFGIPAVNKKPFDYRVKRDFVLC